jgi:hypothetical protein
MSTTKMVVVVLILLLVLFVIFQLTRSKKKTSAGRPIIRGAGPQGIIVLYTFDAGPDLEHLYMMEASIISVLRELGSKALILVYTTDRDRLAYLEQRYNGQNGVTLEVRTYISDSDPRYSYEGGLSMFNKIGHARIFLINKLLLLYQKPVIYLDNDTLITDGQGTYVESICFGNSVYGYIEETWVLFSQLYSGFKYTCTFDPTDTYYANCLKIHPINNGAEVYPYNETSISFAADVISTYISLEQTCRSHFHDMLAFSMVWYKYPGSKCLSSAPYDSTGLGSYGLGTGCFVGKGPVPPIIHYYLGKYDIIGYISSVVKLMVERFIGCGALYLTSNDVSGCYLINHGLTCKSCPPNTICTKIEDIADPVTPFCGPGAVPDCAGICSGPSVKDCAGICYNPLLGEPPNLIDCGGQCYQDGTTPPHTPDCAGACYAHGQPPLHAPDCHGVCDGTSTFDCAGVCGGLSYQDCGGNCINPVCDL